MAAESPTVDRASVDPRCDEVFREIEARFEKSSLPSEKWYLTALGSIVASPEPQMAAQLYSYLLSQPSYSSRSEIQALTLRFHEAILKTIALLGIPKPAEAVISIADIEPEHDPGEEVPFSRQGWQSDTENHDRGMSWLRKIYAQNTSTLLAMFRKHRDFASAVCDIAYGLYLSDRQILDDVDTEILVLSAVMGQNLPRMAYWHIRGCRRLGISEEDTKMLCDCVHAVACLCGTELDRVRDIQIIEEEI